MVDNLLFFVILAGFYSAWNVGANDAANAIGTSVGSKALTLTKAVFIAAIFEFLGSFFFGSYVTETLSQGIIDPKFFVDIPEYFVLGMLAVLVSTGLWLQIASYFGWPVSTTHTIVGAITGFGFYIGGSELIEWGKIGKIFLSWIFSPFLGGFISYLFFRFFIKRVFVSKTPL